jgi:hypothetical protein
MYLIFGINPNKKDAKIFKYNNQTCNDLIDSYLIIIEESGEIKRQPLIIQYL